MVYPITFNADHVENDPGHVGDHNDYEEVLAQLQTWMPTAPILKALVTTKGDLIVATGSGATVRLAIGSDGQVLTADSAQTAGVKWANTVTLSTAEPEPLGVSSSAGTGSAAPKDGHIHSFVGASQLPPFIPQSTEYIVPAHGGSSTASAYTQGKMYLNPVDVPLRTTFDRIATNITVVGTGSGQVIRMGIYGHDVNTGRPTGGPILDAGTITTLSGTGDKAITISQVLDPGRYWLAWVLQGTVTGSPTVVTINTQNQMGLTTLGNSSLRNWAMSSVTGALPTISGLFRDTNSPIIGIRAQ